MSYEKLIKHYNELQTLDHLTQAQKELIRERAEAEQRLMAAAALWGDFYERWKLSKSSGEKEIEAT
mgnify:CR=1 FL=1